MSEDDALVAQQRACVALVERDPHVRVRAPGRLQGEQLNEVPSGRAYEQEVGSLFEALLHRDERNPLGWPRRRPIGQSASRFA